MFCLTSFGGDPGEEISPAASAGIRKPHRTHNAATRRPYFGCDLKQKEVQSACEESTHKGVN